MHKDLFNEKSTFLYGEAFGEMYDALKRWKDSLSKRGKETLNKYNDRIHEGNTLKKKISSNGLVSFVPRIILLIGTSIT